MHTQEEVLLTKAQQQHVLDYPALCPPLDREAVSTKLNSHLLTILTIDISSGYSRPSDHKVLFFRWGHREK